MSGTTKKKSSAGKGKAGSAGTGAGTKAQAAPEAPTIEQLQAKSAHLPKMIQPKYREFEVPSGDKVIIKKIPIGKRDEILDSATKEDGALDMGVYAHYATFESLVYPELTLDQIGELDPDDFDTIYEHINELSYRKVGEVVKNFPK